ncbi:unnamed protein product [Onchocerca flexuosa]|uniref:DUF1794 domain-containing protein n=1 Tax=Onchocerca flexuosa TaxID=387005 RepID=A0A183HBL7_9BILA|nr:unnamed protein product [Onchocerca flexuosa]
MLVKDGWREEKKQEKYLKSSPEAKDCVNSRHLAISRIQKVEDTRVNYLRNKQQKPVEKRGMDNDGAVMMSSFSLLIINIILLIKFIHAELTLNNQKLEWIIGSWRSEFSGKVFWPTVPTMTFGEELIIAEAPVAKSVNVQFLNFRSNLPLKETNVSIPP